MRTFTGRHVRGHARLLALLGWFSFAVFLVSSESFNRFCQEIARRVGKL
jgi:hypothetical protein